MEEIFNLCCISFCCCIICFDEQKPISSVPPKIIENVANPKIIENVANPKIIENISNSIK